MTVKELEEWIKEKRGEHDSGIKSIDESLTTLYLTLAVRALCQLRRLEPRPNEYKHSIAIILKALLDLAIIDGWDLEEMIEYMQASWDQANKGAKRKNQAGNN